MSPDGNAYFVSDGGTLFVMNTLSGAIEARLNAPTGGLNPIFFAASGVYAVNTLDTGKWQLVMISLNGTTSILIASKLTTSLDPIGVRGSALSAWTTSVSANGIYKLDISSGTVTSWISDSKTKFSIIGLTRDDLPILQQSTSPSVVWILGGPGRIDEVGQLGLSSSRPISAVEDDHGLGRRDRWINLVSTTESSHRAGGQHHTRVTRIRPVHSHRGVVQLKEIGRGPGI